MTMQSYYQNKKLGVKFLRPDGDYRCDAEFKSELADKFLEMGGKIDLIFDDRQKVVDMWRDKGFTVVQDCRRKQYA